MNLITKDWLIRVNFAFRIFLCSNCSCTSCKLKLSNSSIEITFSCCLNSEPFLKRTQNAGATVWTVWSTNLSCYTDCLCNSCSDFDSRFDEQKSKEKLRYSSKLQNNCSKVRIKPFPHHQVQQTRFTDVTLTVWLSNLWQWQEFSGQQNKSHHDSIPTNLHVFTTICVFYYYGTADGECQNCLFNKFPVIIMATLLSDVTFKSRKTTIKSFLCGLNPPN